MNHSRGKSQFFLHPVRIVRNHGFGPVCELHEFK